MRAEAPPCGGSQNSPRRLRPENNTAPTEAELANLQRTLFLNEANAACGVSPAKAETASLRAGRLRLAQHCELQEAIFEKRLQTTQAYELQNRKKTAIKQPQTNNDFP
ncbi:MAG: hypothetical protein K2P46_01045 [Alistipes sp.]|nr:hypothetical protein [Alistipes sp.]